MLTELKFVQGAVARKGIVPEMTHFAIENGEVRSYNGVLALCSPIALDIDCKPKAEPMVKAIANCTETVSLSLTTAGRLRIQSGRFKAFIDCVDGPTPHVHPEGREIDINGKALRKALETVQPFIGNDASRPWSNGVLLQGSSAFATNNICLIEYWTEAMFPGRINIPAVAVKEILRVDEVPVKAQISETSITFHFPDGRWIRSQLLSTEWPDLEKVLNFDCQLEPLTDKLFEGLEILKPFVDDLGRVYFQQGIMRTHLESEEGASFEISEIPYEGLYQVGMLSLLQGVATSADLSTFPSPCMFVGENLRGAIIGMRM